MFNEESGKKRDDAINVRCNAGLPVVILHDHPAVQGNRQISVNSIYRNWETSICLMSFNSKETVFFSNDEAFTFFVSR